MKRFDIITEADARGLEIGSSVQLSPGGKITPLALDTLRSRRVTVLSDIVDADLAALAPRGEISRVAIGSDHSGVALKAALRDRLRSRGISVEDVGTEGTDPVDYPDIAAGVSRKVSTREVDRGILICGTGIGMAIAANKFPGVRAAPCHDEVTAEMSRRHNDVNVLCLSADLLGERRIDRMVELWLRTEFEGGRHARRVERISEFEQERLQALENAAVKN